MNSGKSRAERRSNRLPAEAANAGREIGEPRDRILPAPDSPAALQVAAPATPVAELTEEDALLLLAGRDLPRQTIEALVGDPRLMKNRRVLKAVVAHPQTPRFLSLPRARQLYTFELMELALSPAVPADVKLAAEEVILMRLGKTTAGERLALARRSSTRIATALLLDPETRVMNAALENPRLTEAGVARALQDPRASEALVHSVCRHPRWLLRPDLQIALLRNPFTPLARAVYFSATLPTGVLTDVLDYVGSDLKTELQRELSRRGQSSLSSE